MKKQFFSLLCGTMFLAGNAYAERGALVMPLMPETVLEYQVLHVSPNGDWACGIINNGTFSGWLWNLRTGVLTELTPVGVSSTAWQVSDNGIVAGTFLDPQASGNGAAVESAGYWKEGRWYHLDVKGDLVTNYDMASTAYAISANGKYIAGQAVIDKKYTPVIWEDGVMTALPNNPNKGQEAGAAFTVTDEGVAAGWTYTTGSQRLCALWTPELKLLAEDKKGPYNEARVSPNGRYVMAFDRIYDTKEDKYITLNVSQFFGFQFTGVTNDAMLYGMYLPEMGVSKGCVVIDGQFIEINEYFKQNGVDLKEYVIAQVFGVSGDGKTFGTIAYDEKGDPRTVIVKLDEELSEREPAGVDAMVLQGAKAVELKWRKPLAGADGVKKYEIYRDGSKLATVGADVFTYFDMNVSDGRHAYTVKAVYANATSAPTQAAEVLIGEMSAPAARNAMALQARVNDVRLFWDIPESTLPVLQYYNNGDEINGIGWNQYSLECAVRFNGGLFKAYGENAVIAGVTFYPMSKQTAWKIHVYDADNTKQPLYTETLDASALVYGQKNTVKFATPYTVPAGKDIVIGVEATVSAASANVFGRVTGKKRIGESDLFRRVGVDEDFFSMYEFSMSDPQNAAEENTTWAIGALIQTDNLVERSLKNYIVYENETQIATVEDTKATLKNVADGVHTYRIVAAYSDGTNADAVEATVNVEKNMAPYSISNLRVDISGLYVRAMWDAPKNDDATHITWANGNRSGAGLIGSPENNYSYTAAAKYYGDKIKAYEGYQVKAFRFMPLTNAYFSFSLLKNGEEVVYRDVLDDEYTVGTWNTIYLDQPVELDVNAEYLLALECFEPTAGQAPVGIDLYMSHANVGDLYRISADEQYSSLSSSDEYDFVGNWMIGMVVATPDGDDLGVKGYNIRTGNKMSGETLLNETPVAETSFAHIFDTTGNFNFRVSPVFDEPVGEQEGATITFALTSTDIDSNKVEVVKVYPNPATTYIKAEGDVQGIEVYTVSGQKVAQSGSNRVNVSALSEGTYIVSVATSEGAYTAKISVIR